MNKYIDADRLKAEIETLKEKYGSCVVKNTVEKCYKGGRLIGYEDALDKIKKLQQEQPDDVLIPKWCLENIENTLRIQYNINNDAKDGETCQDRNIKESLNCVRKLLNGKEITGLERLEPLMKQLKVDLDKEIHKKVLELHTAPCYDELASFAHHFYELGKNSK